MVLAADPPDASMRGAHGRVERLGPLGVDEGHRALHQAVGLDEVVVLVAEDVDEGVADADDVEIVGVVWAPVSITGDCRAPLTVARSVSGHAGTPPVACAVAVTPIRTVCRAPSSRGATPHAHARPRPRPPSRARWTSTSRSREATARWCSTPSSSRSTGVGRGRRRRAARPRSPSTRRPSGPRSRSPRTLAAGRRGGVAALPGSAQRQAARLLPLHLHRRRRRRARDRHHPVRGHRRPPGVPVLGRARLQGAVRHHALRSTTTSTRCPTPPSSPTRCSTGSAGCASPTRW